MIKLLFETISPSESNVFVLIPKTPSNSYSLTSSDTNSLILVAKPIQIGSTPDAKGSNVPIKPIFDPFK